MATRIAPDAVAHITVRDGAGKTLDTLSGPYSEHDVDITTSGTLIVRVPNRTACYAPGAWATVNTLVK